ncbi:MAG: hypothetical protein H7Z37_10125 [Pyrinomonadaceae bacterium]|nr:hypothetical protein [Pyrinomonadaceae bacterium]
MLTRNLRLVSLVIGLLPIIVITAFFVVKPSKSSADIQIQNNPAAQGRTITPAGKLIFDAATNQIAVGSLTSDFVRSPDNSAKDGKGRFLIAVNSGFGLTYKSTSRPQQSLSIIDLNAQPEPQVVQNVYFPSPNSANFGLTFDPNVDADGAYRFFVAGGFENKIWLFKFNPKEKQPVSPANAPDAPLTAPSIDVSAFTENAPNPDYNRNTAPVYPMGIALSPDGNNIYAANNLGDTLGIVSDLRDAKRLTRIALQRPNSNQFVYPYDVKILPSSDNKNVDKIYVSLWGDGSIAVISPKSAKNSPKSQVQSPKSGASFDGFSLNHIVVERHPTKMILNADKSRLFVVNSNADSVSIIDTKTDKVVERINVKLAENSEIGVSPEGLALSDDEQTLYVANAHANAVAVISLSPKSKVQSPKSQSKLLGFIPTGQYASAVAVVGNQLFVANGKGTGVENSSNVVNNSGLAPNMPNADFPGGNSKRGKYNPSIVSSNFSLVNLPNERELFAYTQTAMRNNGLLGAAKKALFKNRSPFKHVIYIIRENRTYDQVFGDLATSGDGSKADGDASVAIFGAGETAKSPNGATQNITPNVRNLALRFGLLDRFFVNAEASPDGHNWSTAAFSNDYVDKAFRWNYSGRGRTYDYEGFNRLPSYDPPSNQPPVSLPPVFKLPATETDVANYLKRYVPYLNGNRDVSEPETLYLWDAAKKAGLTYRNYGEFIATVSAEDVKELNTRIPKKYPDISPTLTAFGTKKTLENNFSPTLRNFDQNTPDSFTTDSYKAAVADNSIDSAITRDNKNEKFRGNSRLGEWLQEFRGYVSDKNNGKDTLPNLSIVRFSNDHSAGLRPGIPTPQFYVAENDYAVGRLVEEVSKSPYWKDTAIFIVEDDAQDGADHVDAHRSPGLVISAYNRKGVLVHEFHNTVSLIRTMELCLGIPPMNLLDATATPIDIFQETPDLTPYQAVLPTVALDNLTPPEKTTAAMRRYFDLTRKQNLTHEDLVNPKEMNEIIWFSVRGENDKMPGISKLPAFDLMTTGIVDEDDTEDGMKEDIAGNADDDDD